MTPSRLPNLQQNKRFGMAEPEINLTENLLGHLKKSVDKMLNWRNFAR